MRAGWSFAEALTVAIGFVLYLVVVTLVSLRGDR